MLLKSSVKVSNLVLIKSGLTKPMVRTDDSRLLSRDLVFIESRLPPHIGGR
jgi:hypothetical protein